MASAAWEARNARARSLGYANYYDYRAHGNGRIPPSEPRLSGSQLSAARGHRGGADLEREVRSGDLVFISEQRRGADGRYTYVELTRVDASGRETVYRLRGEALRQKNLDALAGGLAGAGVVFPKSKSLDIRPDVESDLDEDLDELAAATLEEELAEEEGEE